eukprot:Gregarina_sp_Poly_1__2298@NODE_1612_length_3716_cov_176_761304_g173_i1_p2_GENE_NODE_1612_length_3716_cov_176_761304_g173_i1NODE_1612_length_3716_cov_176_761304_g173_i1_p2_ORF_typecomplete_len404_score55_02Peptidase_C97/PF05903_14/8_5e34tRNAsynt_2e/PF02091_15/0_046IBD/PF10416_9/0_34_NODE_1612_length_3716_cov_176_761304_g173_i11811392
MMVDKKKSMGEPSLSHSGYRQYPVKLRVYDISGGAASMWSPILLGRKIGGVWHSGLEVFGYEYFYGGGIVKMKPENVEMTFGIQPTKIHHLGYTEINRNQFESYLVSIMPMFRKEVYDLVNWNCNHFTNHAANHLVSKQIPDYISDLPKEICGTFMGKMLMMFIRMTQGGAAPVAINDPQHPSKMLVSESAPATSRQRRYSCPASPSNIGLEAQRMLHTSADYKAAGVTIQPLSKKASLSSSARRQQRLKTFSETGCASARKRLPSAETPVTVPLSDIVRPRVSFCPGDEILGPIAEDELKRIPGAPIGSEETTVVFSPKHRRLYEIERDRFAPPRHRSLRMSVGRSNRTPTAAESVKAAAPSPLEPFVRKANSKPKSGSATSLRLAPRTVPLQSLKQGELSV